MNEIESAYLGVQCFISCIGLLLVLSGLFASDKTMRSGNLGYMPELSGGMRAWRVILVFIGICFFVGALLFPTLVKF